MILYVQFFLDNKINNFLGDQTDILEEQTSLVLACARRLSLIREVMDGALNMHAEPEHMRLQD